MKAERKVPSEADAFAAGEARPPAGSRDPFERRDAEGKDRDCETAYHSCGTDIICGTDERGDATPRNKTPFELVLDASQGFVPLWKRNKVLRWKFNENSMSYFQDPSLAKRSLRQLFAEAVAAWEDAAPIRFREESSGWDFEIQMSQADNCSVDGCTLASAFFPDQGRHDLRLFPKMFTQSRKEIVDTFIHETGHIFGLRHFFANLTEKAWPSEIFGEHKAFSIMNYGRMSELTADDKRDLGTLYELVWSGGLDNINGTPIVQFDPYHYAGP